MKNFEDYLAKKLENKEIKEEYDKLSPYYDIIEQVIKYRIEQDLTQKELAEKVGTSQSNIARLESGTYNPTIAFLQKVSKALNKELEVKMN